MLKYAQSNLNFAIKDPDQKHMPDISVDINEGDDHEICFSIDTPIINPTYSLSRGLLSLVYSKANAKKYGTALRAYTYDRLTRKPYRYKPGDRQYIKVGLKVVNRFLSEFQKESEHSSLLRSLMSMPKQKSKSKVTTR